MDARRVDYRSKRRRARRPGVHGWTGRALVTGATLIVLAGLFFGALIPIAGQAERLVVALFSGFVLFGFRRRRVVHPTRRRRGSPALDGSCVRRHDRDFIDPACGRFSTRSSRT